MQLSILYILFKALDGNTETTAHRLTLIRGITIYFVNAVLGYTGLGIATFYMT